VRQVICFIFNPPKQAGICDSCDNALYQRDDNQEQAIRNRPEVYKRQKRLLMDYYAKENSMATLNGVASISEAFDEMRRLHSSLQRAES